MLQRSEAGKSFDPTFSKAPEESALGVLAVSKGRAFGRFLSATPLTIYYFLKMPFYVIFNYLPNFRIISHVYSISSSL